jgi:proteasome lid subunit RPN8/RPN11|tara:strand:+ start:47 stop:484 length:438 start_codon:yes stop_codon:yes gene_type:complete
MQEILLNQKQVDTLIQHSEKAGISESCAMLLGTHDDQQWNVKEVFLTHNAHIDSEISFIITPEELLQGYQLAEKKQLELVGVFHSHPNSTASPSNLDKKFMKANGDIPWIIFSGINTDLRAFKLEQDMENTEEIKIKIMERHFFQ